MGQYQADRSLETNRAVEFPHVTQRGSVCGPTLKVFCQHQLCDIYRRLPHVPGQPMEKAHVTHKLLQSYSMHFHHINKTQKLILWQCHQQV